MLCSLTAKSFYAGVAPGLFGGSMVNFVPFKAPEWWTKKPEKKAEPKKEEVKEKTPEENKKLEKKETK